MTAAPGRAALAVQLAGLILSLAVLLFVGGRWFGVIVTSIDALALRMQSVEYRLRDLEAAGVAPHTGGSNGRVGGRSDPGLPDR